MLTIFYGDDEFAIQEEIKTSKAKLGDEMTISLNFTMLDGRNTSFNDLRSASYAVPFLAEQRLVLFTSPLAFLKSETERNTFLHHLQQLPPTTNLLLIIPDESKYNAKTRNYEWQTLKPTHWLLKWAAKQEKSNLSLRAFSMPKGKALAERIRKEAHNQISQAAAERLMALIGEDPRTLKQEVEKLLAYVNYQRIIEVEDVNRLTVRQREESVFEFVDALGNRDRTQATKRLSILLDQQEAHEVFAMVVRQFRILIQARALLDNGASVDDLAAQISELQHRFFMANKLKPQAERFSLSNLYTIYHKLLEMDEQIKTSQTMVDTALFTFIAAIA